MPHNDAPLGLWLDLASLAQRAGATTYARALDLYRSQKVLSLSISPSGKRWLLEGEVQGTQREPYQVEEEKQLPPADKPISGFRDRIKITSH